jgi:uncharacterized protein HemX
MTKNNYQQIYDINKNTNMNPENNMNQDEAGAIVTESAPKSGRVGPTIGIVIIIILILVAGLYYMRSVREDRAETNTQRNMSPESQKLLDAITEMETRVNSSNLDDIDAEVNTIGEAAAE